MSRAAAILRLLARSEVPMGVQGIARNLDIVPSTCLHILRALAAEELVVFDPRTKRYDLGSGVVALARGMLRKDPFTIAAQPVLDALSSRYGATAVGVQIFGLDHMVAVAISRPDRAMQLQVELGSRYPALISATGRCVAAFGGHATSDVRTSFAALKWDDPPSFDEWSADVQVTLGSGYAVDNGRYIAGVTVVSAPVIVDNRVTHALSVIGLSEALKKAGTANIGQQIYASATELSSKLI